MAKPREPIAPAAPLWRSPTVLATVAATFLALGWWLLHGSPQRDALDRLVHAVSEKDLEAFDTAIHPQYDGAFGGSKAGVTAAATAGFKTFDRITIIVQNFETKAVSDNEALANARITINGRTGGQFLPIIGSPIAAEPFEFRFARDGGDWKVRSFRYIGDNDMTLGLLDSYHRKFAPRTTPPPEAP